MATELKRVKLHKDENHFTKLYTHYLENSGYLDTQGKWIQSVFLQDFVPKLAVNGSSGRELCTLGIGTGEGSLDRALLKSLLHKFPRISHHVIEPSQEFLNRYKCHISEHSDAFEGINFHWNLTTLQKFKASREKNGNTAKFHFISALHSLYYVDDLGVWLDYLYDDLLEDGGILLVFLASDTGGQAHLNKEFLRHEWWYDYNNTQIPTLPAPDKDCNGLDINTAMTHFKKRGITNQKLDIPATIDITACFNTNPTPESDMFLDWFSNIINFRHNVKKGDYKHFFEVLKSDKCSVRCNGQTLFIDDNGACIAIKNP